MFTNITSFLQRGSSISSTPCLSRDNSRTSTGAAAAAAAIQHHSMLVQTSFDSSVGHLPAAGGYGIHSAIVKDGKPLHCF